MIKPSLFAADVIMIMVPAKVTRSSAGTDPPILKGCLMSTKLTRLAATSFAAVALAASGAALATPASAAATAPRTPSTSVAVMSTWIKYGDYSSEATCNAKGAELRRNGTYLSYYCTYTGFFTLMVLTR
ncbi:hypothetical protein ACQPYK_01880 [Streptosporangium sp. CA-135522]|uniref:hypothetical protein n=1 Tax=Streptosporangium sp. CA-135522 TaxID=3240072 RepID=UPI003D8E505A